MGDIDLWIRKLHYVWIWVIALKLAFHVFFPLHTFLCEFCPPHWGRSDLINMVMFILTTVEMGIFTLSDFGSFFFLLYSYLCFVFSHAFKIFIFVSVPYRLAPLLSDRILYYMVDLQILREYRDLLLEIVSMIIRKTGGKTSVQGLTR